jgi:hypothetical protein
MTTLRQKVLVVVSAIVITLSFVVLPGCAKKSTETKKTTTTKTEKAIKGME